MRWGLALVLAACSQRTPAPAPPVSSTPNDAALAPPAGRDCQADRDCVLMPTITCCGECAPAPPFEVATRAHLDTELADAEGRCARDKRPCQPPVCAPVPAGCEAKAACVAGRCVVSANGCR